MIRFVPPTGRPVGRAIRVAVGVGIIALGLGVIGGPAGVILAAFGLLPLGSGACGVCPIDRVCRQPGGRCG